MPNIKTLSTDLINAVLENEYTKVSELIKAGANINYRDSHGTPLYYAVITYDTYDDETEKKTNIKIIKLLLKNGANSNVKGEFNTNLIEYAKKEKMPSNIIKLLEGINNSSKKNSTRKAKSL